VFAPRCELKEEKCERDKPHSHLMKDGHFTKCFLWSETSELLSNPHLVQRRIHHKVAVRTLLEVNRAKKYYVRDSFLAKLFGREPTLVKAVDDASFEVGTDEIFAHIPLETLTNEEKIF
jgi:ABC-type glutathione transport system ATPase component